MMGELIFNELSNIDKAIILKHWRHLGGKFCIACQQPIINNICYCCKGKELIKIDELKHKVKRLSYFMERIHLEAYGFGYERPDNEKGARDCISQIKKLTDLGLKER